MNSQNVDNSSSYENDTIIHYNCECCKYYTTKKNHFERHEKTEKHKKNKKNAPNDNNDNDLGQKGHEHLACKCGRTYKHKSNLSRHRKKCKYDESVGDGVASNDLIMKLVEENSEIKNLLFKQFETMQHQITELIPKVGNNNIVNNNNVVNKQKININIFLNEQCKDAITMNEFIDKINVTLDDLLVTKNMGLCEGVSNIFIENMNKLSLYERPMHCTDRKRETVYIKSNNDVDGEGQWQKDDANKELKQAIKKISNVQQKRIDMWVEAHPNWMNNSDEQDEYFRLIKNCTDDLNENNKEQKIIKKVCGVVSV